MITFMDQGCCHGSSDPYRNRTLIHEISHSWSGNLVTPMNWNCLYLNEGLTDYLKFKMNYFLVNDLETYLEEASEI